MADSEGPDRLMDEGWDAVLLAGDGVGGAARCSA